MREGRFRFINRYYQGYLWRRTCLSLRLVGQKKGNENCWTNLFLDLSLKRSRNYGYVCLFFLCVYITFFCDSFIVMYENNEISYSASQQLLQKYCRHRNMERPSVDNIDLLNGLSLFVVSIVVLVLLWAEIGCCSISSWFIPSHLLTCVIYRKFGSMIAVSCEHRFITVFCTLWVEFWPTFWGKLKDFAGHVIANLVCKYVVCWQSSKSLVLVATWCRRLGCKYSKSWALLLLRS